MSIESGKSYKISNVKSGTVLDLSGTDGTSIIGYTDHGGNNQRWQLEQGQGGHWTLRSGNGRYLGIGGSANDGTPLIGVNEPVKWDIYPDENDDSVFRLYVPGAPTAINVDLSDHGNPAPGTPVTLWGKWEGQNQIWRFERV